jgi:hypothetical protein
LKTAEPQNPPRKVEVGVGIALTLWIVVLHILFLTHAGALWRDECEVVGFATMPTMADTFHSLHYGNFPPLSVMLVRFWTLAGLGSDAGYRVLGFLIGLGTLGALWFAARALGPRAPLLALALFAANPLNIRIGDSIRAYGLGILLVVLTQALIWKFIQTPRPLFGIPAAVMAVLSVQSHYACSWFVLAFCMAGWAVTLPQKQWKTAGGIALIGLLAALSMLIDVDNLWQSREWFRVTQASQGFDQVLDALLETCRAGGPWMAIIWSWLFGMALAAACMFAWQSRPPTMIYSGVTLALATALFLGFMWYSSVSPRMWHFPILLAPTALAIEGVLAAIPLARVQWARATLAVVLVLVSVPICRKEVTQRQTNIDLVAQKLKASTRPGDMIVVSPWYFGLSLRRYLDERKWTSIPPIADYRFHRYDLLRERMASPNPIGELEEQIRQTLRGGHAVWVAGMFRSLQPGAPPPKVYPPYRDWMPMADALYTDSWVTQIGEMIRTNGCDVTPVSILVPDQTPVNMLEDVSVRVIRSWRGE